MKNFRYVSMAVMALNLAASSAFAESVVQTIDVHCHIAGIGAGGSGCFVSDRLRNSWKYGIFLQAFGMTESELLKEGDSLVVKRLSELLSNSQSVSLAVVLAMDGVVDSEGELDRDRTEIYIPNEFVAAEVKKYSNLLFGASVNPFRRDAIDRLVKVKADGAVLVKWLPPIQNIDPADPRLVPFYLKLKDLGLPLLTHTGSEKSFTRSHDELGDPERLRLPLSLGVTVIAAHCACSGRSDGERNFERFLRLSREYPNLYGDISALTQINRLGRLREVLGRPELRGRLLYGTDMPLINTSIVTPYAFPARISLRQMHTISGIKNPWDRDTAMKKAMGVGNDIFSAAALFSKADRPDKQIAAPQPTAQTNEIETAGGKGHRKERTNKESTIGAESVGAGVLY